MRLSNNKLCRAVLPVFGGYTECYNREDPIVRHRLKGVEVYMSKIYAYARVSTEEQHIDRQIIAIKKAYPMILDEDIFIDKKSGKNFDREEYQILKRVMRSGDTLVIQDTDRLGRNKKMVKEELSFLRKQEVRLRILNIPTTLIELKDNDWVMDMVNNILIEVYTALDEQDYHKRRERQREGIEVAKTKGVYKGRKRIEVDWRKFESVYRLWRVEKKIQAVDAQKLLELNYGTFYRRVREYEVQNGII